VERNLESLHEYAPLPVQITFPDSPSWEIASVPVCKRLSAWSIKIERNLNVLYLFVIDALNANSHKKPKLGSSS